MGNVLKFICIILLLSGYSCGKDDFEPDFSGGKTIALKNGEAWTGQGRGTVNNFEIGLNMYYDVFDDLGQLRQRLGFSKLPEFNGQVSLHNTSSQSQDSLSGCSYTTFSHDGDVIEDRYYVVESETESYVKVLDYNATERLLTGIFRVKLFINPGRPKSNPNNPDTILFDVGSFEVRIEE